MVVVQWIAEVFSNGLLISALLGWFFAQFTKMILFSIQQGKFSPRRMRGDGGMPSCHSATVVSLAASAGFTYGFDSPWFAIATVFAIVVIHDATGVRAEAGKHAQLLNMFMHHDPDYEVLRQDLSQKKIVKRDGEMKEFLGHTPMEVIVGGVIGFFVALIFTMVTWPAITSFFGI